MSTANRSPYAQTYNEMHGLVVQAGKHYCHRENPDCHHCPLGRLLLSPKDNAGTYQVGHSQYHRNCKHRNAGQQ
jgi:hypothetical protein